MLGQSPPKDILSEFRKECNKTNVCGHLTGWPPNWDLYNKCMDRCINDKIIQWQTTSGGNGGNDGNDGGENKNSGNGENEIAKAGFPVMPIAIGVSALALMCIIYILVKGRKK